MSLLLTLTVVALVLYFTTRRRCGCDCSKASSATYSQGEQETINGSSHLKDTEYKKLCINGSAQLEKIQAIRLKINGNASLEEVSVKEHLQVNGKLDAHNLICATAQINGKASLKNTTFTSSASLCGYLEAENSKLGKLTVLAAKIHLTTSSVASITVKRIPFFSHQTIELTDTVVEGDIDFYGGQGAVILRGSSVVKGTIRGGTSSYN